MKRNILVLNFIALFIIIVFYILHNINEVGFYTFPLDDTYIHLAVAKNLALYDTWGITKYEFSSTSSSPLFTLLLSILIRVFGVFDYYPLLVNSILIIPFFILIHKLFKGYNLITYSIGIVFIVVIPIIHIQVLSGMEHMFQIVSTLCIIYFFNNYFIKKIRSSFPHLLISTFLLVSCRYESLFLIAPLGMILILTKEYYGAIHIWLAAIIPVTLFGIFSIYNGADFFPNSLLLKGNTSLSLLILIKKVLSSFWHNKYLVFVILSNLLILLTEFKNNLNFNEFIRRNWLQIVIVCTILEHSAFASFGWLYRYDAYIKILSVITLVSFIHYINSQLFSEVKRFLLLMMLLGFTLFSTKSFYESFYMFNASNNIYEQQIQMAKFLNKYYNNSVIVANDIGAIAYYTDIHLIDLYGLGNNDIQKIRRKNKIELNTVLQSEEILTIIEEKDPVIAIIYDSWFTGGVPNNFHKVGTWRIKNNVVCGSDSVSFYSVGKENSANLRSSLEEFNTTYLDLDVETNYHQ